MGGPAGACRGGPTGSDAGSVNTESKEVRMPKLRTKSSAKKRFSVTGRGKVKRNFAYKRHCLEEKPQKMKRQARGTTLMARGDERLVRHFMPYLPR